MIFIFNKRTMGHREFGIGTDGTLHLIGAVNPVDLISLQNRRISRNRRLIFLNLKASVPCWVILLTHPDLKLFS